MMGNICEVIGHSVKHPNGISFDLTKQILSYHCTRCEKVIEEKPILELNQEERVKLLQIGLNIN